MLASFSLAGPSPRTPPDRRLIRPDNIAQANAELLRAAFNRVFVTKAVAIHAAGAAGAKGVEVSDLRAETFAIGLGPPEPTKLAWGPAQTYGAGWNAQIPTLFAISSDAFGD